MWKESVLAYLSELRDPGRSSRTLPPALPSQLAIYSARSNSSTSQTIVAMHDAYVDFLVSEGAVLAGQAVFVLNNSELVRETFKLNQELLLSEITAARLDDVYVEQLIYGPLKGAVEFAQSDLDAASKEDNEISTQIKFGKLATFSLEAIEIVGLVEEKSALLSKAKAELIQRQIEIDGQKRRLKSEQTDLAQRIELNKKIYELHKFSPPQQGIVKFHTYSGGFVREDDPICTIAFEQPLQLGTAASLKGKPLAP